MIRALLLAAATLLVGTATASAAPVSASTRVTMSDGVSLQATVTGEGSLAPRPVMVEFSPYGRASQTLDPGPDFNVLLVQIRGTGDSDGRFDALGPRTQADVAETLGWACHQPWSDGRLALNGFSASAITVYNSLHLALACVKAAVLRSGTFELYRDLLDPGGVSNVVPAAGVLGLIGVPALAQGLDRLQRNPASAGDVVAGLLGAGLNGLTHTTLDGWWRERGFRGDVNHLPILMVDGFFDVESRGAFEAYRALRGDGAHLLVTGGHDGAPQGTDGGHAASVAWLEHYVRGVDNGADRRPRVELQLADGDREGYLAGDRVPYDARDWPVPGTRWTALDFDAARSGVARSLNDGSLRLRATRPTTRQSYPAVPSIPLATDPPNAAILGSSGLNAVTAAVPGLTDMSVAGTLGLSYTSAPLRRDVLSAGPASVELPLSSTAPKTTIWVVLSDVAPDGTAHPLTAGRLSSDFPGVDRSRSLIRHGQVVEPYGTYDDPRPATPGVERRYAVELWPDGNRFRRGHRIRVDVLGASAASLPTLPGLNTIRVGGRDGARLLLGVLPGSDLAAALR